MRLFSMEGHVYKIIIIFEDLITEPIKCETSSFHRIFPVVTGELSSRAAMGRKAVAWLILFTGR